MNSDFFFSGLPQQRQAGRNKEAIAARATAAELSDEICSLCHEPMIKSEAYFIGICNSCYQDQIKTESVRVNNEL